MPPTAVADAIMKRQTLMIWKKNSVGVICFSLNFLLSYIAGALMMLNAAFNFYVIFKVCYEEEKEEAGGGVQGLLTCTHLSERCSVSAS